MLQERPTVMHRALIALSAVVLLAGCGSDDDDGGGDATTTAPAGTTVPGTGSDAAYEEAAIADLAERQGVDPADIMVVSVENVTWPDSSLGCPEEGTQYAQMLTDGVRIVLELDGQEYEYRAALGDDVFYCENPQPPVG